MKEFKAGDRVAWRSSGGRSEGYVKKKVTKTTKIKGHVAKASSKKPQYVVVSDTGREAVHRPESLEHLPLPGL